MRTLTSFQLPKLRKPTARAQRGVTLMLLVGIMGALMALVIGLNYKVSDVFSKAQALDSDALLSLADNQLHQYVVVNGRLPCPALNGDGISAATCTSSQQKGYLPYITLGMADNNYVFAEVPILYGAYNDGNISFTSSAQVFFPSYTDASNAQVNIVAPTRNMFDFCASLATLKAQSASTTGLSMTNGSDVYTAVYALALPGQGNRGGQAAGWGGPSINAQYSGRNAQSATQFELPQHPVTPDYGDRTMFRAAAELHDSFRCEALNSSVSLLAQAVTVQKETEDFANGNSKDVAAGLLSNEVGIAVATVTLGMSIAAVSSATEVLTASSALLATAAGTCPIPPFVTCALIPVYAVAVGSASTGEGLSIAAAVVAGIGLGLNITTTVLYADLKSRTSTTPSTPTVSISTISADRVLELKTAYSTSKATAQTAYAAVPTPVPDQSTLNTVQLAKASVLDNLLNLVNDSILKTVLSSNLNGNSTKCVKSDQNNCAGYTERQVPKIVGGEIVMSDGNPVMTSIYTKDNLSAPYAPGVKPALSSYYQALAQAGANTSISGGGGNKALDDANAALAAAPVVDPATALNSNNGVVTAYNNLLTATADFDAKNLSYEAALASKTFADTAYNNNSSSANTAAQSNAQGVFDSSSTARSTALASLRTAMGTGNEKWDHTGNTSLCGGGTTTGCGWMRNPSASANAGSASTMASTASNEVNDYLTAFGNYQVALAYQKLKDAADTKARIAWSDRNGYKTALCATATTSVSWLGGSNTSSNPANWDAIEHLLDSPVNGLDCSHSAAAQDLSSQTATARTAEKTKYCTTGTTDYDANLCALYSTSTAVQSTIQGAEPIVNALIQKGVVK